VHAPNKLFKAVALPNNHFLPKLGFIKPSFDLLNLSNRKLVLPYGLLNIFFHWDSDLKNSLPHLIFKGFPVDLA
jgi:hypothetical protein